jgi:hypothetical protein
LTDGIRASGLAAFGAATKTRPSPDWPSLGADRTESDGCKGLTGLGAESMAGFISLISLRIEPSSEQKVYSSSNSAAQSGHLFMMKPLVKPLAKPRVNFNDQVCGASVVRKSRNFNQADAFLPVERCPRRCRLPPMRTNDIGEEGPPVIMLASDG